MQRSGAMTATRHVLGSLLIGGLLLSSACAGAAPPPRPSTPSATAQPPAREHADRLPFGTTDPAVLGPRHYPDWAYEPELFAATGELRARPWIAAMDRLKDVPIPSLERGGGSPIECAVALAGSDDPCDVPGELPDRLLIDREPAD